MAEEIEIIAKETVYRGYLRLEQYRLRYRRHDGSWTDEFIREICNCGNVAAIIPFDPEADTVVLVEQFRLPAHLTGFPARQVEIPAGLLEPGESPELAARREMWEETGLEAIGEVRSVGAFLTSPGALIESIHAYCARVDCSKARFQATAASQDEDIRIVKVKFDSLREMLSQKIVHDTLSVAALWWLLGNHEELRCAWNL